MPEYGLTIRNGLCSRVSYSAARWKRTVKPEGSSIRDNSRQWKEKKREARTVFVIFQSLLEIGQVPILVRPSNGPYILYLPQLRILGDQLDR